MSRIAVDIAGITMAYGRQTVVESLSLSITAGSITGIIGPNGAGKTTLVKAIAGLEPPVRGTISLFGENVLALSPAQRARLVGVVPQSLEPAMDFTVEQMVTMGRTSAMSRWTPLSPDNQRIIERAMIYTDVVDMRMRRFNELSGGEKQRVAIAMAIAQQPRVVLLDEATAHLDINHCIEIMQLVERLNREQDLTIIMVSHDLNLSARYCRNLILMHKGKLVAHGPPPEVMTEENLRRSYHCNVSVIRNPASGFLTIMPAMRGEVVNKSGRGKRVHLVCGGGSGEEIMRRLALSDYTVTCGVLNEGDSDAAVAVALDMETALEKPFSPITDSSLAKALDLASRADAVVVCGVPFGPGNIPNLKPAREALRLGKPLFIMKCDETRDYTPDQQAVRAFKELEAGGALEWNTFSELLDMLPCGETNTTSDTTSA